MLTAMLVVMLTAMLSTMLTLTRRAARAGTPGLMHARAVTIVVAMALLLMPRVAEAHLGLSSSTPANGAQLAAAPRSFRLTFTEPVERSIARVRLVGPDGAEILISALHQPADSAQVLLGDILGPLVAGPHTIEWRVTGADGHPVRGTVAFVIEAGAVGVTGPQTGTTPSMVAPTVTTPGQDSRESHHPATMPAGEGFDAGSGWYVVVRWLQFAALLVVIGAVAFRFAVLHRLERAGESSDALVSMRTAAGTLGLWACLALGLTALLRLHAQSLAMHGPEEAFDALFVGTMLFGTLWGWALLLQLIAAGTAAIAFVFARRGRPEVWAIALLATLALAATPALSGHAAATPTYRELAITLDALHVVGAGGWLGSLLLVLVVGIPVAARSGAGGGGTAVARLVSAFSPTALIFAGIAAATGVVAAWLHIGFSAALWESDYGRTLLIKLAILAVVVGTGAYNWLRVKPRLGDDVGTGRVRRSAVVELVVAALVLLATAVLVATPPPTDSSVAPALNTRAEVP